MNSEFIKLFIMCVTDKYAQFNGRASRKEYWSYVLADLIITAIFGFTFGFLEGFLGLNFDGIQTPLSTLLELALLCPSLSVAVRRLHDTGRSGLFLLLAIVPSVIMHFSVPILDLIFFLAMPFSGFLLSISYFVTRLFSVPHPSLDLGMFPGIIILLLLCMLYPLYLTILNSTSGENKYGPNPKGL